MKMLLIIFLKTLFKNTFKNTFKKSVSQKNTVEFYIMSYNSSDLHKLNKDELVYLITILQEQNTITTKNKSEKVEIEKFVEYVELSPDFIGSTITAVYKHKHKNGYGQRYSSYDDGSILVFEYKTKDASDFFVNLLTLRIYTKVRGVWDQFFFNMN